MSVQVAQAVFKVLGFLAEGEKPQAFLSDAGGKRLLGCGAGDFNRGLRKGDGARGLDLDAAHTAIAQEGAGFLGDADGCQRS